MTNKNNLIQQQGDTLKTIMRDSALTVLNKVESQHCTSVAQVARLIIHALAAAEAAHADFCEQHDTHIKASPSLAVSTAFGTWLGVAVDSMNEQFKLQDAVGHMLLGFVSGMAAAKSMQDALICTQDDGPLLHLSSGVGLLALGIEEPGA